MFKSRDRVGIKGDFSEFEHGMVVGARQAGLCILETADPLYREWSKKEEISRE